MHSTVYGAVGTTQRHGWVSAIQWNRPLHADCVDLCGRYFFSFGRATRPAPCSTVSQYSSLRCQPTASKPATVDRATIPCNDCCAITMKSKTASYARTLKYLCVRMCLASKEHNATLARPSTAEREREHV